jgi:hypothetical protein
MEFARTRIARPSSLKRARRAFLESEELQREVVIVGAR